MRLSLLATLAMALLAAGCGGHKLERPTSEVTTPYPAADYPDAGSPPHVRLVQAGSAPTALRYIATAGHSVALKSEIEMAMTSDPPDFGRFKANLSMLATVDTEPSDNPDEIVLRTIIRELTGDGSGQLASIDAALAELVGATETATMGPLGLHVSAPTRDKRSEQLGALQQGSQVLAPVLPTEAVGIGGSWAVLSTREVNGLAVKTTTTYTLTKLEGSRATFLVNEEGVVNNADATKRAGDLQVKRLSLRTEGNLVVDLEAPAERQGTVITRMYVQGAAGGTAFESSTTVTVTTELAE